MSRLSDGELNVSPAQAWLLAAVGNAESAIPKEEGDYYENGLLYCGKCHTPKECVTLGITVPTLCACMDAARKAAEEEEKRKKEIAIIEWRRTECFGKGSALSSCTFAADEGANPKVAGMLKRYVENFDELGEKGLILIGKFGAGKTYYAAAVANELIDRKKRVRMATGSELMNQAYAPGKNRAEFFDALVRYDLVILDDLGAERSNSETKAFVYDVINTLYNAKKPFIVTTNLELKEIQSPADDDFKRITGRILERCVPIQFVEAGSPMRQRKREQNAQELIRLLGGQG